MSRNTDIAEDKPRIDKSLTREMVEIVTEAMAAIEEKTAAEIKLEIEESTSDYEADDLSYLMDETLARADYIRSFRAKLFPAEGG